MGLCLMFSRISSLIIMVLGMTQYTGLLAFQHQHYILALLSHCCRSATDAPREIMAGFEGGALEISASADYLDLQTGFFENFPDGGYLRTQTDFNGDLRERVLIAAKGIRTQRAKKFLLAFPHNSRS